MYPSYHSVKSPDGIDIYYEKILGKKEITVVLLHGLGGELTAWNEEREKLTKKGFSTIAIDLRGHGFSGRPHDPAQYEMSYFVQDVEEVIKVEHVEKYILVGHCFGGMVTLSYVTSSTQKPLGIILVDTSYKAPFLSTLHADPILLQKMFKILASVTPDTHKNEQVDFSFFQGTTDFSISRLLSDILRTSLKSYFLLCEVIVGFNILDLLQKISVPTLIMEGTQDHIMPPAIAQELNGRIKNSEMVYIKGGNHIVIINNPGEVAGNIVQFLKQL